MFVSKIEEIKNRLRDVRKEWNKAITKLEIYDESLKDAGVVDELEDFLSVIRKPEIEIIQGNDAGEPEP